MKNQQIVSFMQHMYALNIIQILEVGRMMWPHTFLPVLRQESYLSAVAYLYLPNGGTEISNYVVAKIYDR